MKSKELILCHLRWSHTCGLPIEVDVDTGIVFFLGPGVCICNFASCSYLSYVTLVSFCFWEYLLPQ